MIRKHLLKRTSLRPSSRWTRKSAPCACSPLGRFFANSQPYTPGGTPVWTTYTYDGRGWPLTATAPDGAKCPIAAVSLTGFDPREIDDLLLIEPSGIQLQDAYLERGIRWPRFQVIPTAKRSATVEVKCSGRVMPEVRSSTGTQVHSEGVDVKDEQFSSLESHRRQQNTPSARMVLNVRADLPD